MPITTSTHPPKLKFTLVTETFKPEINGVAMTLGKIVDNLIKQCHQVQVIRPKQSSLDLPANAPYLEEHLVGGISIPFYRQLKLGLPAKNKLIKLWRKNKPDIVHIATEGPLGWSALQAAKQLKIPTISSFHTNFHQYSQHYGLGLLTQPIQAYLKHFHNETLATLAPTQKLANELSTHGYRNVSVMARGVDTRQFNPAKRCAKLRQNWGIKKQDVVVLYVGRLAKEKNIDLVIRAFAKIQASKPTAKLVFVGEGPLQEQLSKQCPQAIFAGSQRGESLATHYASGDIFLFPSLTETFGNVVPEALASGLALVAYDYAAAAQLIRHTQNGMLATFADETSFVKLAEQVASDANLLNLCRTQARKSVQHLDWQSVSHSLEQHLYRLLDVQNTPTKRDKKAKRLKIKSQALNQVAS